MSSPPNLKVIKTLERFDWVLLGSNAHIQRPLMMLQELKNLKKFNWILVSSNLNTHLHLVFIIFQEL